jgi:hypothetical protein
MQGLVISPEALALRRMGRLGGARDQWRHKAK